MKINAMQSYYANPAYSNRDCRKKQNPAFGLKVSNQLETKVLTIAVENGSDFLGAVKNQIANLRKWGNPFSELSEAFDFNAMKTDLGIDNKNISKMYGASLPNKSNLLDTVMSLTEKDIVKSEQHLKDIVAENKLDLITKALKDKELMKKVAGKVNPTDEELAAAIDRLPEERIVDLRFGLDEPSKFNTPNLEHIVSFDFPID